MINQLFRELMATHDDEIIQLETQHASMVRIGASLAQIRNVYEWNCVSFYANNLSHSTMTKATYAEQ